MHDHSHPVLHVCLQELRGLGMTATNEEPEWKVAALGKVRAVVLLSVVFQLWVCCQRHF
jgi:hypothetical protein